MSNTFAQCARKLAGAACRSLGWRPSDFWNSTPAEVVAIFRDETEVNDEPLSRNELRALLELDRNG